jgi:predicted heme/steroid binding protein/uncharacterized membrane protein
MEKEFDPETLSKNDGKEGRPAYISHGGRVIDVSSSKLWKGGIHMGRHGAGKDLTTDIGAAPHGTEVLDRYPQVGSLVGREAPREGALPPFLEALLDRYPFLRRHPHPAIVHFPVVLTVCTSFFSFLAKVTGHASFDETAFYCLIGSLLFIPLGIITGFFTWWVNYMAKPMLPVTVKKYVSLASFVVVIGLFIWRLIEPGVLIDPASFSWVYFVFVVALAPAILVVSAYGGSLTFPSEKR